MPAHWFVPGAAHFVTYRLFGSLSEEALRELRSRKESILYKSSTSQQSDFACREAAHKKLFGIYERWLDQNTDPNIRWLAKSPIAAMVRANLYHHNGTKYHLLAYCIMPNHVHVLLHPLDVPPVGASSAAAGNGEQASGFRGQNADIGESEDNKSPLSSIMHSLKSYTAHEANKLLLRTGPFWQSESYDHWVRDEDELERIVSYIAENPIKAGMVKYAHDWFFCSAHDRFLAAGEATAWLA